MRARLADPGRGRDLGRLLLAFGLLVAVLGWVALVVPATEPIAGFVEAIGLLLAFASGPFGRWRRPPVDGDLELLPGRVVFRPNRKGPRTRAWSHLSSRQILRARDVLGASTSALGSDGTSGKGVTLVLARASRPAEPTLLTFENEVDADAVRRVLGVGHGGRGAIAWRRSVPNDERIAFVLSACLAIAVTGIAATHRSEAILVSLTILALYALPLLLGLWAIRGSSRRLLLTPRGVEIDVGSSQPLCIGYAEIARVRATREGAALELGLDHRQVPVPIAIGRGPFAAMTHEDRDHMVAQIDAALSRARGRLRPRDDASSRLEALRRGAETAAQWLARLDAMAATLVQPAGYRGAPIDAADLWLALEDPDADLELRCAAARVLTRQMDNLPNGNFPAEAATTVPRDKLRVATAVAAADPVAEKRIRLAVEATADDADETEFAALTAAARAHLRTL